MLKEQSTSDLPIARQLLGRRSAKCTVRQVNVKRSEIDPVEKIEELKAELEVESFRNVRRLVNVNVGFKEIGRAEGIRFLISLCAEGGLRELP